MQEEERSLQPGRQEELVAQGGQPLTPTPRFRGPLCGWGQGKLIGEFPPPPGKRRGKVRHAEGSEKETIKKREK